MNFKRSHAFDYRSGTPIEFDVPSKEDASAPPSRPQSNLARQSFSELENSRAQVNMAFKDMHCCVPARYHSSKSRSCC